MLFLHKVDDNGLFIEDCILEAFPTLEDGTPDTHFIETPVPQGFILPKWDGTQWVEGGTAPEPQTAEPTIEERVKAAEDAIVVLMGGGV